MAWWKLDLSALEQLTRRLNEAAQTAEADLQEFRAKLDPSEVWEGRPPVNYIEQFEQWRATEAAHIDSLLSLQRLLKTIADQYENMNAGLASTLDVSQMEVVDRSDIQSDVYLDTDDEVQAVRVFAAVDEMLVAFGFQLPEDVRILRGSIRRKAKSFSGGCRRARRCRPG